MSIPLCRLNEPSRNPGAGRVWAGVAVLICAAMLLAAPATAGAHLWAWSDERDSLVSYPPLAPGSSELTAGGASRYSVARSGGAHGSSMAGDPTVNVALSTAANVYSTAIPDGSGGMIVVWEDQRNATTADDIYAQHLLPCGAVDPSWPPDGVALTQAIGEDQFPVVASDGSGGAIVAWSREFSSVMAQHVLSGGAVDPAWPSDGLVVCSVLSRLPKIASDGAHGAYVAWDDRRSGGRHAFVQHLLSSGVDPSWTVDGVATSTFGNVTSSTLPVVCTDGAGGAIVAWNDNHLGQALGIDIYAQHLSPSGVRLWGSGGAPVCTASGSQAIWGLTTSPLILVATASEVQGNPIVADGAGGCLITWMDGRSANPDVYAQRLTSSGTVAAGWPSDGAPICTDPGSQTIPTLVPDGAGGAIATWSDTRAGVYAQHVTGSGLVDGPSNGLNISPAAVPNLSLEPLAVSDGAHGANLTWTDTRNGAGDEDDIYATHVLTSPLRVDPAWMTPDALPVSTASGNQFLYFAAVSNGAGGLIAAWTDDRNDPNSDQLYGQEVRATGALVGPPSTITATAGVGGSISPSGAVAACPDPTFTVTASVGFHILDVKVDGVSVGAVGSYPFTNVTSDHTIAATFAPNGHMITASAGSGGTISPSGAVTVADGGTQQFTFTPANCQLVGIVTVDGSTVPTAPSYTFTNVTANHTIAVTFVPNPAPVATVLGPVSGSVYPVNTPVSLSGSFTDNSGDTHTASWTLDALPAVTGTVNEADKTVGGTFTFTEAGVYLVTLTVADQCGGTSTTNQVGGFDAMIVVYDPEAGFVTGGGWINSPAGAYAPNPTMVGKANFGFVSKYEKGKTTPTGDTEFQFKAGDLNFHSTSYDWLVISGARAQYQGSGSINGQGDYGFMLTAIDGQVSGGGGIDKFRMKILNKSTNAVVYDNQMGLSDDGTPTTALGGGSIVIHSSGGAGQAALLPTGPTTFDYSLAQNRPNPFSVSTELQFSLRERSDVSIAIYDLAGREVLRLVNGELDAGLHSTAWTGRDGSGNAVQKGVYFVRMTTTALRDGTHFTTTRRMVVL